MSTKQPATHQRKRSSLSAHVPKDLLQFKLFPITQTTQHLQKRIQTYSSFSLTDLRHIFQEFIDLKSFKNLVCHTLQFDYMYHAILTVLDEEYQIVRQQCKIKEILEILIDGKFYRKLPKENQALFIGNSKGTATNVKCLIAAILSFVGGKFHMNEISHIVKVFQFQQKLNETYPFGIPMDNQRILRILKKLQRSIKPLEFKQWIEDLRRSSESERIQNYQFLYLVTLTSKRIEEHSCQIFNVTKTKQSKSVKQNNQVDQEQKMSQNSKTNQNTLGHNQKYRLRSLQYQKSRDSSLSNTAFREIKTRINLSQAKLSEKKKCLSLATTNYKIKFEVRFKQARKQSRPKQNAHLMNLSPFKNSQIRQKLSQHPKKPHKYSESNQEKQNERTLNAQILPIIIKGKQKLLAQLNRKKLVLTQEENKISQGFFSALHYEEQRLARRHKDIIIEDY